MKKNALKSKRIRCIGQGIHILNQKVAEALETKDAATLHNRAQKELDGGADGLDINLGPSRSMHQRLEWLLDVLDQELAANPELFLWAGALEHIPLLSRCTFPITINAVTAEENGLQKAMEAATALNARLVVLLVRPGMTDGNSEEQLLIAEDVLRLAAQSDLKTDNLYLDPVINCTGIPASGFIHQKTPQLGSAIEVLQSLPLLGTGIRTVVGLGNSSYQAQPQQRSLVQCRALTLLAAAEVDTVICDCTDQHLMHHLAAINEGQDPFVISQPLLAA
jgi:cobalamin-dependent methionine synthase I